MHEIEQADAQHNAEITVEVAYARPDRQVIIPLRVMPGTTAESAVLASDIIRQFPEISLTENSIGIFGKPAKADTVLRHMDRVEIYRPLIADPKAARRQRAAEGKAAKKDSGAIKA
ncbi:MAG TPA: RnfH family protein [Methylophilaceae bacterium]|nr:RnfH family protein [Methylophilaceae bacterium]